MKQVYEIKVYTYYPVETSSVIVYRGAGQDEVNIVVHETDININLGVTLAGNLAKDGSASLVSATLETVYSAASYFVDFESDEYAKQYVIDNSRYVNWDEIEFS